MQLDADPILLYKLITGELIIGVLDRDLTEENKSGDILYIRQPAENL